MLTAPHGGTGTGRRGAAAPGGPREVVAEVAEEVAQEVPPCP